jgi:DNA-3-methyladenine glycosylase
MRKRYSRTISPSVSMPPTESELTRLPILPRGFYDRDPVLVAREVLGTILLHQTPDGIRAGRIVEAEAYLGVTDLAAHASRGITPRTKVLFGPPGHAYVYLIYGMYECLNFVAEPPGQAGCVLIRALEPLAGIDAMFHARTTARKATDLCSGPGRLTLAMDITRRHNGIDLTHGPLTVRQGPAPTEATAISSRIGVNVCADWPLRFYLQGNPYVSKGKPSTPK